MITLFNREEYEYHQKKVEEAKKREDYYFNPESGRDDLDIKVSKLTFEVFSTNKTKLNNAQLNKLKLVDYDWLTKNSWKKIAKLPYNFKEIYFLYKIKEDCYIFYKVGVTIIDY